MKLEPVTKINKRNKATSKIFHDNVMPENCDFIAIFSIYGQSGAMQIWITDA